MSERIWRLLFGFERLRCSVKKSFVNFFLKTLFLTNLIIGSVDNIFHSHRFQHDFTPSTLYIIPHFRRRLRQLLIEKATLNR